MDRFVGSSIALLASLSVVAAFCGSAHALEFRKCNIDAVIAGVGLPVTTIPGSGFFAWARQNDGRKAALAMNKIANDCLAYAVKRDIGQVPKECAPSDAVHQAGRKGSGLTGFQLTRGLTAIKNLICNTPGVGTSFDRTQADLVFDKRVVDGFSVSWRKRGGSGACRGAPLTQTQSITVVCRASRDMLRLDRFPARLYRGTSNAPASACKAPVAVRGHGDSVDEARRNARNGWARQVTQQFGTGFADFDKLTKSDYACVKTLSGERRSRCTFTATPCYY